MRQIGATCPWEPNRGSAFSGNRGSCSRVSAPHLKVASNYFVTNAEIAELLAIESESAKMPAKKALRRASRRALMWPDEAEDLLREGRSLIELVNVGPYIAKLIRGWIEKPPKLPKPPEIRRQFLTITEAKRALAKKPDWLKSVRGDLQMHTTWSDGEKSIEEMARAAQARGYEYILITDHSQSLGVANGLTPARLMEQRHEIDAVNKMELGIRVLQGAEVEIKADGSLDFPDEVLASLDVVLASLHTSLRQEREKVTQRALAAIRNPHVDIFAHPTGRLNFEAGDPKKAREGADLDMEAIITACHETGTILEINASPERLDLNDLNARRALDVGCSLVISTDAHNPAMFNSMLYGVAMARRAWATPDRVVNTWPVEKLLRTVHREA